MDVEQVGLDRWLVRCRSCSAMAVGDSEGTVRLRWEQWATVLHERDERSVRFVSGVEQDCCKDPRNLRYHGRRHDLTIHLCGVCHRKHYQLWCEPGRLFAAPSPPQPPPSHRTFDLTWS